MAVSQISLTSSMRSNLLSLQNTQKLFDTTQNRLSTGKKVNSAMDNPSNFFTSQALTSRANDLSSLLDSIGQSISTLETADQGITTLTKYVEQAKALANSARDTANVASSKTSGVKFDAENVKTQLVTDAVGGISAGDSFTVRLGNATSMTSNVNLNATQKLSDLGMTAGTTPLEIIVDGESYKVELAAGDGQSYNADTKTMTMGLNSTVQDFMDNVVENIGRKKVSAELVDGRMEIKTLDNTSIALRSDPTQVDAASISTKDIDAMIAAANVGAKGAGATPTAITAASTVGDLKASLNVQKAALEEILASGKATGNTEAKVTTDISTEIDDIDAMLDAIAATGIGDSAVVGADSSPAAGSLQADVAFKTAYADLTAINLVGGSTATSKAAITAGRAELATQTLKAGSTTISLTGTETLESVMSTINAGGEYEASVDGTQLILKDVDGNDVAANAVTVKKGATPAVADALDTSRTYDTALKNTAFNDMLGFDRGSTITITDGMTAEDLRVALNSIEGVTADFNDKGNLIIKGTEGDDFIIADKNGKAASLMGVEGSATNGNNARASYASQFDAVLTQIDQLVQDTSYKGINLLNGDNLTVNFNETRTSFLEIKGVTFDSKGIGMTVSANEWKSNADIDKALTQVEKATSLLRAQASEFGQNLATVQTREDFTTNMINNLVSGSDKLTLADMNEEAANMLALQTRQQLATNSLSMASQAAQSVLSLF